MTAFIVVMVCAIAAGWLAERIRVPYPIVLVLAGIGVGFAYGGLGLDLDAVFAGAVEHVDQRADHGGRQVDRPGLAGEQSERNDDREHAHVDSVGHHRTV